MRNGSSAKIRRLLRRLKPRTEQVFSIAIYHGPSPFGLAPLTGTLPAISRADLHVGAARYVADPFMVKIDDLWHMYFEVLNDRSGLGEIGLATSSDLHSWTYRGVVLSGDTHLSYPMIVQWAGELYMIPESHSRQEVVLYRATSPTTWVREGLLLSGPFRDMTVLHHEDNWWMFGCDTDRHDSLRLFMARSLTGPWQEHPCSPLRTGDASWSRPAGRVLNCDGSLYRFAQDANPRYGARVRALRIDLLNPEDYEEQELGIVPNLAGSGSGWNADGMHHVDLHYLASGEWVACVDGWVAHVYLGNMDLTDRLENARIRLGRFWKDPSGRRVLGPFQPRGS